MHIQPLDTAPVNERGGQKSWLLLTEGQFGAKNLAITWVEGAPGSMQGCIYWYAVLDLCCTTA